MNAPVYIHGMGLLTGLDRPGRGTWDAMAAGERLCTRGVVADALLADKVTLHDRALRIAMPVARQALEDAQWNHPGPATGFFVGSSKGLILTALQACDAMRNGQPLTQDQIIAVTHGPAAVGDILSKQLGFVCGAHTSVAACASGLFALHAAIRALRAGECQRALVLATDASLHALMEGSFQRLGLIAPADADGKRWCNPFHESGAGFFLSEAAAAVAISSRPPANGPCLQIHNAWVGADAGHLLAIDEQTSSLRAGLRAVSDGEPVDFVQAHATGTTHDAYERAAIESVCGRDTDIFSSKYWLGHSLGAAGLVSLVLSAMCHWRGQTLTGRALARASRSVTIAQGFGGHIAVVGIRADQ